MRSKVPVNSLSCIRTRSGGGRGSGDAFGKIGKIRYKIERGGRGSTFDLIPKKDLAKSAIFGKSFLFFTWSSLHSVVDTFEAVT